MEDKQLPQIAVMLVERVVVELVEIRVTAALLVEQGKVVLAKLVQLEVEEHLH